MTMRRIVPHAYAVYMTHGMEPGILHRLEVDNMPTEEELEQRITEQIDKESFERAILSTIDNKSKAVTQ